MKTGDTVEVLGKLGLGQDSCGVIERIDCGRIVVCFSDGWRRFYNPDQLRVVELPEVAKGTTK